MGQRFLLAIIATLSFCGAVAAGGPAPKLMPFDVDTLVIPAQSPVKFMSFDKGEVTASFAGRVTLSGTYHYGDDTYLVLDRGARALLPYWKDRPGDGTVMINNAGDFAKAAIPATAMAKYHAGKGQGSITGRVSIVADGYTAMIVCDAPNYSVHFVSLATTKVAALNRDPAEHGC